VRNKGSLPIWRVRLNLTEGLAIRGNAGDDRWLVGKELLSAEKVIGVHNWVSPGTFPFDLVAVEDDAATVYALYEDPQLLDTRVEFGRDGGPHQAGNLSFTKYPRIDPGDAWAAPPLVIGSRWGGCWHRAGGRFPAWGQRGGKACEHCSSKGGC